MIVPIENIIANPYRDIDRYPISKSKVAALVESINQTDFWDNLLARPKSNMINGSAVVPKELKKIKKVDFVVELAYGHHRLEAVKEAGIKSIDIPVKVIEDEVMLQIMANENKGDWASNMAVILETVRQVRNTLHEQAVEFEKYDEYAERYSFFKREKDWKEARTATSIGYRRIHQFLGETWKENDIRNALQALKGVDDGIYEQAHIIHMPSVGIMTQFTAITNAIWGNDWPSFFKNTFVQEASDIICDESQGATVAICRKCASMTKKGNHPITYLLKQKVVPFELWREVHKLMTDDEYPVTVEEIMAGKIEGLLEATGLDEAIKKAEEKITKDQERKERAQGGETPEGDEGGGEAGEPDDVEAAIAGAEGEATTEGDAALAEAPGSLAGMAELFINSSSTFESQVQALRGTCADMDEGLSDKFGTSYEGIFATLVQLGLEAYGKADLLEMIEKAEKSM